MKVLSALFLAMVLQTISKKRFYRSTVCNSFTQFPSRASSTDWMKCGNVQWLTNVAPPTLDLLHQSDKKQQTQKKFNYNSTFRRSLPEILVEKQLQILQNSANTLTFLLNSLHQFEKKQIKGKKESEQANGFSSWNRNRPSSSTFQIFSFYTLRSFYAVCAPTHTPLFLIGCALITQIVAVATVKFTNRRVGKSSKPRLSQRDPSLLHKVN